MSIILDGTNGITFPTQAGTASTTQPSASKVYQALSAVATTGFQTNSTSFVNIGLSATITPSSSTSKILIIAWIPECYVDASAKGMSLGIARNGSIITTTGSTTVGYTVSGGANYFTASLQYLDSPSTTSSTTYSIQVRSSYGSYVTVTGDNSNSYLTILEVAS